MDLLSCSKGQKYNAETSLAKDCGRLRSPEMESFLRPQNKLCITLPPLRVLCGQIPIKSQFYETICWQCSHFNWSGCPPTPLPKKRTLRKDQNILSQVERFLTFALVNDCAATDLNIFRSSIYRTCPALKRINLPFPAVRMLSDAGVCSRETLIISVLPSQTDSQNISESY